MTTEAANPATIAKTSIAYNAFLKNQGEPTTVTDPCTYIKSRHRNEKCNG